MARRKFTKVEREDVMELVAKLDRQGMDQTEIAREIGVSQTQVSVYMAKIRERYKEAQVRLLEEKIQEKLAQYRDIRKEAWQAWERSKANTKQTVEEKALRTVYKRGAKGEMIPNGEKMKIVKVLKRVDEHLPANEYLLTIARCLLEESKLEGLLKPDGDTNNNNIIIDFESVLARATSKRQAIPIAGRSLDQVNADEGTNVGRKGGLVVVEVGEKRPPMTLPYASSATHGIGSAVLEKNELEPNS